MEEKTTRKQQAEATKEHILKAFKALLKEKSFQDIGIQDICKCAGISTGGFYHHFGKKTDLIIELFEDFDYHFYNNVLPSLSHLTPEKALSDYISLQFDYIYDFGYDLVKHMYIAKLENNDNFFSESHGFLQGLVFLLERCGITGDASEAAAREILIIINGVVYNWCIRSDVYDIKSHSTHILDIYLAHILAK